MKSERARMMSNAVLASLARAIATCEHDQAHLIAVDTGDKPIVWCPWCGAVCGLRGKSGWQRPMPARLLDDGLPSDPERPE